MERRDLPEDLIEEILRRVPTKALARFRTISKAWYALLSKPRSFAKMYSANAPKEESLIIMLMDFKVYLVRMDFQNKAFPSFKTSIPFYLKDPLSNTSQVNICNVFHCDGLLLCTTKDKRLVVWNPYLGETKWIKLRESYEESDYYALGYDIKSSCKQYKVLRITRCRNSYPIKYMCEVFDFTSDSWRCLGVETGWYLSETHRGISIKGNTYWIATIDPERGTYSSFLLSFDFSKERFKRLSLPIARYPLLVLSVVRVAREEKLCLLGYYGSYLGRLHVSLWTSTIRSVILWRAFLDIETSVDKYTIPGGISFLADLQNKVVLCCEPNKIVHIMGENMHGIVDTLGRENSVLLNYVPSFAPINQIWEKVVNMLFGNTLPRIEAPSRKTLPHIEGAAPRNERLNNSKFPRSDDHNNHLLRSKDDMFSKYSRGSSNHEYSKIFD